MTASSKRAHVVRLLCGSAATLLIAGPALAADPIPAAVSEPVAASNDPQAGEDVIVKGHRQALVDAQDEQLRSQSLATVVSGEDCASSRNRIWPTC